MVSRRQINPVLAGIISFAAITVAWEEVVRLGLVNPFFASQPSAIVRALIEQTLSGELLRNVTISLAEFALGFAAAAVIGILVGMWAGRSRTFEAILDPFLWFLYSAPLVALYPLFVISLGLGWRTVVAITFLLAVTPITANTLSAMKEVNPSLIRAAESFGATENDVLWKVMLPAALPLVVAGLRLGVGRALTGVVVAELFGATAGLGYSMAYYGALLKTTEMLASLMVVVVLGVILTQGLRVIESRFDSWRTGPEA
jgi:NitT/TauT family transport system permease protein